MTLRTRLAVAFGVVVLALAAIGLILPRTVRSAQLEQVDRQLTRSLPVAQRIASNTDGTRPPGIEPGAPPPGGDSPNEVYVARVDTDGTRTELFSTLTGDARSPSMPTVSTPFGDEPHLVTVGSDTGSGSWRAMLVTTTDGSSVLIAVPLDAIEDTAQRIDTTLVVAGGIAVVVVLAAGWWVFRLGLRPIGEVTRVAAAYASGERAVRVAEAGPRTEAGQLARTFNLMLDEQQAAEDRLRRFVADASHELRNPVAAIGGFADLHRHGAIAPDQLDDVMRRIGQESARMRGLVEDMLLLARLDEARPLEHDAVDLAAVAADAALDATASHPSRTVTVRGTSARVHGDEAKLRQVVANLLANALLHTERDVEIEVRADEATASVLVTDHGPGLDGAALAQVFDRFWQADTARTGTGSGLGLAIVKGIVEAHGGAVTITSTPAAGTAVTATIPVAGAPRS